MNQERRAGVVFDRHANGTQPGQADLELMRSKRAGRIDLDELNALAQKGEIETVVCAIPDIWGRLVGKRVTPATFAAIANRNEELHGSLYLFAVDMDMNPQSSYALTGWEDGFPDFSMVPDLGTMRVVPWLDRTAIVICDPHHEDSGELVEVAPRVMLKRQIERYAARQLSLKCATELEFYLFADNYRAAWEKRYRDLSPLSYYRADYHVLQSTKDDWFLRGVRTAMDSADIEIEFSKTEWGLGQQEVNLRYCDVLEMADRHIIYKNGVKEMAIMAGLSATFMAKPAIDEIGSSCHVHASLWDDTGERPLSAGERSHDASELMTHFIAGQVEHGCELALMFAPTINSFKRFQAEQFAGTNLGWGYDNRTAGLRVVGEGRSLRLEHRVAGADANPYLMLAALAGAGLAGIEGELACPEPIAGNAADVEHETPCVPRSYDQALALFERSEVARTAFGPDCYEHLRNFYALELEAFRHDTVTDWELIRYFERI